MLDNLAVLDADGIASESDLTAEELVRRGERLIKIGLELRASAARLRGEAVPIDIAAIRAAGPGGDHSVSHTGVLIDFDAVLAHARKLGTYTRVQFQDALGLDAAATSKWIARLHEARACERVTIAEGEHAGSIGYHYIREIEDESPALQLREWAAARGSEPFDLETAEDGTGLPGQEVQSSISDLLADGTIAPVVIEAVDDLGEIEKLGGAFFAYVPPIPGGVQSDLERRRLASAGAVPQVKRGMPVRIRTERKNARARSTPGSRQKVINQDRNWERLQAAATARDEQSRARAARERDKPKPKPKGRKAKRSRPVA